MKLFALVVAAASLAPFAASAADPIEFRGVPIGASQERLREAYPEFSCSGPTLCTAYPKGYILKHCRPLTVDCANEARDRIAYGPVVPDHLLAKFEDDKLRAVSISVMASAFDSLTTALTEKYGRPAKTGGAVVSNAMGAKFPNRFARWERGGVTLLLQERNGKVDTGSVTIADTAYISRSNAEADERIKGTAKRL